MTALDDALAAEREAKADAATAETTAAELQNRLELGDATVTPTELDDAHRFAKWARSHALGATTRRERAAADAAVASAVAAIENAASVAEIDAELVDAWRATVRSVSTLVEVAQRRSATISDTHNTLLAHRGKVAQLAGINLDDLGALPPLFANEAGYRIPAADIAVHDVRPVEVLAEAIATGNAGRVDLSNMTVTGRPPLPGTTLAARVIGWDAAAREVAAS